MYQLIRAIAKLNNFDGRYHPVDITSSPLYEVYANHINVYVTLTHSIVGGEHTLDLDDLPQGLRQSSQTLSEWLVVNGNNTLPVTTTPLDLTFRYARFYDLWQWDFMARGHNQHYHPDIELDVEEQVDVLVTKDKASYRDMAEYCLFTVNGFLHPSDYNQHGVYILGGGITKAVSNQTYLGMVDFQHLGKIHEIPITEDLLVQWVPGLPLKDAAYIKVPESLVGKVPMLSIGGYLHPMGSTCTLVADDIIKIDFANYNWMGRYLESKDHIDLSSLGITSLPNGAIDQVQFYSDTVLTKYLTLVQSFIILVESNYLDVGSVPLSKSGLVGRYLIDRRPKEPVLIGHGRLAEYKATRETDTYVVAVSDYLHPTLALDTVEHRNLIATSSQASSIEPVIHSNAKLLVLSRTAD